MQEVLQQLLGAGAMLQARARHAWRADECVPDTRDSRSCLVSGGRSAHRQTKRVSSDWFTFNHIRFKLRDHQVCALCNSNSEFNSELESPEPDVEVACQCLSMFPTMTFACFLIGTVAGHHERDELGASSVITSQLGQCGSGYWSFGTQPLHSKVYLAAVSAATS